MSAPSPCLCGCACHIRELCACGCATYAPDYVAASAQLIEQLPETEREAYRKQLKAWTDEVAVQMGYRGPSRRGKAAAEKEVERTCEYCGGKFRGRSHAKTCSGSCRQALSKALRYRTDADVPSPYERRDDFSRERLRATGEGLLNGHQTYAADMLVRLLAYGDGEQEAAK